MGVERGESNADAFSPNLRGDSFDHLQGKTCAVLDWAGIVVVASVVDVTVDELFK